MLKKYITRLIKRGIVNKNVLSNGSFYNIIKIRISNPQLALFYIAAHYQYHVDSHIIYQSLKIYLNLKSLNIKIDIGLFKAYNFHKFYEFILQKYQQEIGPPNVILNDITEFKSILQDSEFVVVACITIKHDEYIDDYKTLKFYGSPNWCLRTRDHFKNYTTKKNSIQYVILKKSIYNTFNKNNMLHRLNQEYFNSFERIGITLSRNKKLKNKKFWFWDANTKIICHNEHNGSIENLGKFNTITNNFPIHKIHNKLIKIINKKQKLNIPKNDSDDELLDNPYEAHQPSCMRRIYRAQDIYF